jgi:hypothetical protein
MAKSGNSKSRKVPGRKPVASSKRVTKQRGIVKGSLTKFFAEVRQLAAAQKRAGAPVGSCHFSNPGGGPSMCVPMDRKTCATLKGRFLPGSC